MPKPRLALTLFAAAVLFSMVREWNAPVACVRIKAASVKIVPLGQ